MSPIAEACLTVGSWTLLWVPVSDFASQCWKDSPRLPSMLVLFPGFPQLVCPLFLLLQFSVPEQFLFISFNCSFVVSYLYFGGFISFLQSFVLPAFCEGIYWFLTTLCGFLNLFKGFVYLPIRDLSSGCTLFYDLFLVVELCWNILELLWTDRRTVVVTQFSGYCELCSYAGV